jgi:hypothetical protein
MNGPQALAVLSLALLVGPRLADIYMEKMDLPLFKRQLLEYKPLTIAAWFGDQSGSQIGEGRIKIVLRMAMFCASVRTSIVSLVTGISGLIWTVVIIYSAQPVPVLRDLRGVLSAGLSVLALIALVTLFTEAVTGKLTPTPVTPYGDPIGKRLCAYIRRLTKLKYLTTYTALTFLVGVFGVFATIGID